MRLRRVKNAYHSPSQSFRIGFYQADLVEPIHVHVRRQHGEAKFWMTPISLADSRGFRPHELSEIEKILTEHREDIVSAWAAAEAQRGDGSSEG